MRILLALLKTPLIVWETSWDMLGLGLTWKWGLETHLASWRKSGSITLLNSEGSMTSRISSSSFRNITSLGLWVLGQNLRSPTITCETKTTGVKFSHNTCLVLLEAFLSSPALSIAWVASANCSRFSGSIHRCTQVLLQRRRITCWATSPKHLLTALLNRYRLASDADRKVYPGAFKGNYRLSETAFLLQELYHTVCQLQKIEVERKSGAGPKSHRSQ